MAFKLTKSELTQLATIRGKLEQARMDLDGKIDAANDSIQETVSLLEADIVSYNELLEEARGFAADIVSVAESEMGEKSDTWLESSRGAAVRDWISEWEQVDLEDVPLPTWEPLELTDEDHAANLDGLPIEAE